MDYVEVAIAVVTREGKVLISQRKGDAPFAGLWEFPGGKCAPGETPLQCLARELLEEVAISVHPLIALPPIDHRYPKLSVRLHPFLCAWKDGEPRPLACEQIRWVAPLQLRDYEFPAANRQLIEEVILCLDDKAA